MLEGEKYVKSGEWHVGWYQVRRGCCRADAPQWRRGYPEREDTARKIPWMAYARQRNPLYGKLVQSNILCNKKKKITLWWAYCIIFTFYKDALKDFFASCKHGAIRNEHPFSDTVQAHAEKWPVVNWHWQDAITAYRQRPRCDALWPRKNGKPHGGLRLLGLGRACASGKENQGRTMRGIAYAAHAYTHHYEQNILRSVDSFIIPVRDRNGKWEQKIG